MSPDDLIPVKPLITNDNAGNDVTTHGVAQDTKVSEFLAGATATATQPGTVLQMPVQNAAAAADVAALKTQFDALLVKLKNAGLMASS